MFTRSIAIAALPILSLVTTAAHAQTRGNAASTGANRPGSQAVAASASPNATSTSPAPANAVTSPMGGPGTAPPPSAENVAATLPHLDAATFHLHRYEPGEQQAHRARDVRRSGERER